jgi:hypothetical protein
MSNPTNAETGCRYLGEFVEEAELPPNAVGQRSEVVRPQLVYSFLELCPQTDGTRLFTILLKDGRTVSVRGHALKQWPPTIRGDCGSYGVVMRAASDEILVALFRIGEVVGIFNGGVRSPVAVESSGQTPA